LPALNCQLKATVKKGGRILVSSDFSLKVMSFDLQIKRKIRNQIPNFHLFIIVCF
jgi:hypothetical protein